MKKNIILYLSFLLSVTFSSCYKDTSTLAENLIEKVVLDTTGIQKELYVGSQDVLTLTPKIKQGNRESLTFEWSISEEVKTEKNTKMKPIGDQLELRYEIERPIASIPYMLQLTITDRKHGNLQYFYTWDLNVQSTFITGLIIADTKDGITSNLTYVKNKDLSTNYDKEEVIYRNILKADSVLINGLVSSLNYTSLGRFYRPHVSQLWVTTTEGKVIRYDTGDFSVNGHSDKANLILYKPENFKFNFFVKGGDFFFANTNYGNYSLTTERVNTFSTPDPIIGKAQFNNNVVAGTPHSNAKHYNTVWLEESTGAFTAYTETKNFSFALAGFTKTSAFDPNTLNDKIALTGEISQDNSIANFLLKDKKTNTYGIFQLDLGQSQPHIQGSAKGMFSIPLSFKDKMDAAVSYFFSKTENLLYVATQTEIYTISFGLGDEAIVNTTPIYVLPANEQMKKSKLFLQGQYAARANDIAAKLTPELPLNLKALIVVSQRTDNQGVVHILPLVNNGTKVNEKAGHTYDGFGKVLDVIGIGM